MITGKLNIDLVKLKDSTDVTCKLVFEDMEETGNQDDDGNLITSDDPRPLETQTTIHKRGLLIAYMFLNPSNHFRLNFSIKL